MAKHEPDLIDRSQCRNEEIFRLSPACEAYIGSRRRWVARSMAGDKSQDRVERLKAALKENLKRRKAQARGRKVASGPGTAHSAPNVSKERDEPSD
ncbi:hypothetical protein GDR74_05070 [Microvirga thermotolerans]|uniref:Uncharacterized protein n=1 Tax=Microvirga thermotolerans TaxID=2651334 RepID=A0A5P9K098_9HYPH|nr:hypothetical protein GDR74_05070 [Microvirga thermotolerans]